MFRSMPFVLIAIIALTLLLSPYFSLDTKQFLYAVSLTIKSGIVFLLPFIIFSLLFKTMVGLARQATAVITLILICVCCSNFTATFLSHYMGMLVYHTDLSIIQPKGSQGLMPAWVWEWPKLIENNKAMFAGIILGIVFGNTKPLLASNIAQKLNGLTFKILRSFTYIIPIFVLGFVVKLQYDDVIHIIIKDYALIFGLIALAQFGYIFIGYAALNWFNINDTLRSIKNMLPAGIAGFSSMSSAAVMPLTIAGAERNAKNPDLVRSIIPCTANIHLMGDCFAIPILAFALMKSFGMPEPSLMTYIIFVCYFVLAKFSVAAIPGGGIVVMIPILEAYLGFNSEMISLITALYILFDPVITCANVLGNGAFAKLIDKLVLLKIRKPQFST